MKNPLTKKERITIRLTPNQMQCLTELKDSLNTTYSLLTRSIIGNFLTQYENNIEEIIEVLQENDTYIEKCLKSLLYSFKDIYTEIHCKYVDKIVLSNNKKVFVYDYETDNFKVSNLPYNQEEEYIVIILADYDLENRIPFFNYFNLLIRVC